MKNGTDKLILIIGIFICALLLGASVFIFKQFEKAYAAAPNPGHTWTEIGDILVSVLQGGTGQTSLTLNNLLVGNGTSAVNFIAPGANDNILKSNGTSWVSSAPSYDISAFKRYGTTAPERWYTAPNTGTALTTGAPTANTLRAIPLIVPDTMTFDAIAINVTTLLSGNARLGIYADNGNLYPGSLVLDAGTVSTTTTGVKSITINQTLNPGLYWLVLVSSAAPTIRCFAVASMIPIMGFDNTLGTAPGLFYTVAFTYAALPGTYPASATVGTAVPIPAIFVRRSS